MIDIKIDWNNWDIIEEEKPCWEDNYIIILNTGFNNYAGVVIKYRGIIKIKLFDGINYDIRLFSNKYRESKFIQLSGNLYEKCTIEYLKDISNVLILGKDINKKELCNYICEDEEFLKKINNKEFILGY